MPVVGSQRKHDLIVVACRRGAAELRVEVHRCLHVLVPKQLTDQLKGMRMSVKIKLRRDMPEQVHMDAQAEHLEETARYLHRQVVRRLVAVPSGK